MQIGCNDSVGPFEVEIEPALAVLTAAMEERKQLPQMIHNSNLPLMRFSISDSMLQTSNCDGGSGMLPHLCIDEPPITRSQSYLCCSRV